MDEMPLCPSFSSNDSSEDSSDSDAIAISNIKGLLEDSRRVNVMYSFSMHAVTPVEGGMRIHLVMKFKYDEALIQDVLCGTKPETDYEKRYGEAYRIFPYCIFNSIDEVPISWTYQNTNGRVYERVEMYATVTDVNFTRYFPFVLKVLNLKVGSDGTGKTGKVNLLPELQQDGKTPNVDFSIFRRSTSDLYIKPDGVEQGNVVCRMVVRDLSGQTLGNLAGVYTRVYTVFFFESYHLENMFKYIMVSLFIVHVSCFCPFMELSDMMGTMLTLILTEVALLFTLSHSNEVTTAETIMIAHINYMFMVTLVLGIAQVLEKETETLEIFHTMVGANMVVTILSMMYIFWEYSAFLRLVKAVKAKFRSVHDFVSDFKGIDELI
eukprot:TRINITY_DN47899_c0_g1_i1.p1 TRINITY_DN47899_c0_g1~~TRINITY_DN47899_c0_g1_i1.p1  ORF type:complete len:379 (-),score=66.54 TRINITY_DN47899_c0_g1_i1:173-1309(-)